MKYITYYETEAAYDSVKKKLATPQVALTQDNMQVHFQPYVPPMPITYAATEKLLETSSTGTTSGLHVNSFSGFSGQLLIKSHTFENGVGTIEFDGDVVSIGNYAFYGCTNLTSINIPDSVTTIGNYAFSGCTKLSSINIPDGVTSIGNYAFTGCTSLPVVNNIRYADTYAVSMIQDNYTCAFKDGTKFIGSEAFVAKTNLTSINIPNSVTSIGEKAFKSCSNLTSINILDSVTSIGNGAFAYCKKLTSINIPDGVTSIGQEVFIKCSGLTSCTIGSGVTSIGYAAFSGCTSLTSINIPDSVTNIGNYAFSSCSGLITCTLGSGVTSIGGYAFYNCRVLTSIDIPNSVTNIGTSAFYYCTNLSSVTCRPTTPPTLGSSAFDNNAASRKIYVTSESVDDYKAATNWSSYASDIEVIQE